MKSESKVRDFLKYYRSQIEQIDQEIEGGDLSMGKESALYEQKYNILDKIEVLKWVLNEGEYEEK